jgi:hypothetical protein
MSLRLVRWAVPQTQEPFLMPCAPHHVCTFACARQTIVIMQLHDSRVARRVIPGKHRTAALSRREHSPTSSMTLAGLALSCVPGTPPTLPIPFSLRARLGRWPQCARQPPYSPPHVCTYWSHRGIAVSTMPRPFARIRAPPSPSPDSPPRATSTTSSQLCGDSSRAAASAATTSVSRAERLLGPVPSSSFRRTRGSFLLAPRTRSATSSGGASPPSSSSPSPPPPAAGKGSTEDRRRFVPTSVRRCHCEWARRAGNATSFCT